MGKTFGTAQKSRSFKIYEKSQLQNYIHLQNVVILRLAWYKTRLMRDCLFFQEVYWALFIRCRLDLGIGHSRCKQGQCKRSMKRVNKRCLGSQMLIAMSASRYMIPTINNKILFRSIFWAQQYDKLRILYGSRILWFLKVDRLGSRQNFTMHRKPLMPDICYELKQFRITF